MKIIVGDIFLIALLVLWLIWTTHVMKIVFKYRIKKVKNSPEIYLLEGMWWMVNVILPLLIFVLWGGVKLLDLIIANWDKTI